MHVFISQKDKNWWTKVLHILNDVYRDINLTPEYGLLGEYFFYPFLF